METRAADRLVASFPDTIRATCIDRLVMLQAQSTPDAIAIEHAQEMVSYRELAARAASLAAELVRLGAGPGAIVAIMIDRSTDMIIGMLGILASGAAYLPLDPDSPVERLAFMVSSAGALAVVSSTPLAARAALGLPVVLIDARGVTPDAPRDAGARRRSTTDLCYLMFTSGSTGEPKGVLVEHAGVLNRLAWMYEVFEVRSDDRFLHKTPLGFDVSVWEIFMPLICGARIVLADAHRHADAAYLTRLAASKRVTVMHFVPSMLRAFLNASGASLALPDLRYVVCSGEELTPALQDRFFEVCSAELYNLYGPTEASIEVTSWRCRRDWTEDRIPIGWPIANVAIEILDETEAPVAPGLVGEIYIGGVCLARGYLGRPDLTHLAFRELDLRHTSVRRYYRTGDLGRRRPDGSIEYLGRCDSQIKLRGYRIELGEIEGHLERHSAVGAVALILSGREEAASLHAYVVPRPGAAVSVDDLRRHSEAFLPHYMWPSQYLFTNELPLTSSGKADRHALAAGPPQCEGDVALDRRIGSPTAMSQTEAAVAELWSEYTGKAEPGPLDNFFSIGGDSIRMVQVIGELNWKFDVDIDLRNVISHLTVRNLAAEIDRQIGRACEPGGRAGPVLIEREAPVPLSFSQERLWLLDQLGIVGSAYVMPLAIRVDGPLQVDALTRSFEELVRRHEILRTYVATWNDRAVQVVDAPDRFRVEVLDLASLDTGERLSRVRELIGAQALGPFDLGRGPLFRVSVLRLAPCEHVVLVTMHHIIADGWSLAAIIPREIGRLYEALAAQRQPDLPPLPLQYSDFAIWQRQHLQGPVLQDQVSFWRNSLAGAPPALELPTDRPRPGIPSYRGSVCRYTLPPGLVAALRDFSRQHDLTLYMTLLAGWQVVLARWSGQEDFLVGSPVAGRTCRGTVELIGLFVNTVVLRADLSGDPSFLEVATRARAQVLGALAHQEIPFETLIAELQPERDLSRAPLFQVLFSLHNEPREPLALSGLKTTIIDTQHVAAKFDLALHVFDADGMGGYAEYATDLFDHGTIEQLLAHFTSLLEMAVKEPARRLSGLLVPIDRRPRGRRAASLRERREEAALEAARQVSLVQRFEEQAARNADSLALTDAVAHWTYDELNRRANGIAASIVGACGVGPGQVGLLFGHENALVSALLAVLKAGKTYVPLDPSHAAKRITHVLRDAQVQVVVAGEGCETLAATCGAGAHLIEARACPERTGNPVGGRTADSIAYILYTSGTTGRPKGVFQSDRNVCHFIEAYARALRLSAQDRLTMFASFAFDAAVMDIFGALLSGASLHLRDLRRFGFGGLSAWLADRAITVWHSTPTLFRAAAPALVGDAPRTVRYVVLGGEEASWADVALSKRHFGTGCVLVNGYGPTESTVTLQYFADEPTPAATGTRLPIGWPVDDTEIILFGRDGRRTDVVGEIGICSDFTALGYWGDAEQTERVFMGDVSSGTRTYRTGDRARLLPDGGYVFLGRLDDQIKIRGQRVAMTEIEATIQQHPLVRQAVVAMLTEQQGGARLVAYVVCSGEPCTAAELKEFVARRLPPHMVPCAFMTLEALPLKPNGKVDLQALPTFVTEPVRHAAPDAACSAEEQRLAQMWVELLSVEQVGADDDFFALGGDSLLAMWLIARIRDSFGVELRLLDVFEAPTVARLVQRMKTRSGHDAPALDLVT